MSRRLHGSDSTPIPLTKSSQVQAGSSLAWAPELLHWQNSVTSARQQEKLVRVWDDVNIVAHDCFMALERVCVWDDVKTCAYTWDDV